MEFENGIIFGASLREKICRVRRQVSFMIDGELVEF